MKKDYNYAITGSPPLSVIQQKGRNMSHVGIGSYQSQKEKLKVKISYQIT